MPVNRMDRADPAALEDSGHRVAHIDRVYCRIGKAGISVLDWELLRSDATDDVVSVRRGSFFRSEDHLDRSVHSDELLLTSTAGGVMPVCLVNGNIVGDGRAGPVVTRIRDLCWAKREAGWHGTPVIYDR